jgi:Zn-dependent protease
MFRSVPLGRAFGIPLFVHPTFLLLPLWGAVISWPEGPETVLFSLVALLAIFACVLLHELGHALMARRFGIRTRDVTLYPIGGVARLESAGGKPHEEIAIALAGPAVNLVIALALAPFVIGALALRLVQAPVDALGPGGGALPAVATFLTVLCFGNVLLLAFNLLPAFPMDGGRVLRALLSLGLGPLRGTEIAAYLGLVMAAGLVLLGLLVWPSPSLVVVAVFVAFAGQMELLHLRRREARRRLELEAEAVPVVRVAPMPILPLEEVIISRGPEGFTGFQWDRDNCVWVRWVNGRPVEAR